MHLRGCSSVKRATCRGFPGTSAVLVPHRVAAQRHLWQHLSSRSPLRICNATKVETPWDDHKTRESPTSGGGFEATNGSNNILAILGRRAKFFAFAAAAGLEFAVTGGLLWAPLLAVLVLTLLAPSQEEVERNRDEEIKHVVHQVRNELLNRVPATPPESGAFMTRMLGEFWASYFVPMLLKDNLQAWQEKIAATAPLGWDIELVDMNLGKEAPQMSNFQVFNNPVSGKMVAMDCDMLLDSPSMRVVVRGSGPVGQFTATVSNMKVKGSLRFQAIPEQRMLLWSYKLPPDAVFKLQVKGPLMGEHDIPQFSFIKSAFNAAIRDYLVEPRRAVISLDYDYIVQQALDTNVNIFVEAVEGLLPPKPAASTYSSVLPAGKSGNGTTKQAADVVQDAKLGDASRAGDGLPPEHGLNRHRNMAEKALRVAARHLEPRPEPQPAGPPRKIIVTATNMDLKLQRMTSARPVSLNGVCQVQEAVKLSLGQKEGIIKLEVKDAARNNKVLGKAFVCVAAAKDGCSLFWALGQENEPLAIRWHPPQAPWKVTLPLEDAAFMGSSVTLSLSTDLWLYQQQHATGAMFRSPGARTIVLQVMEGRYLAAKDWAGTSDAFVQIGYDSRSYRTRTVYSTRQPLWNETFVLQENTSALARRVRLEVMDSGVTKNESLGHASLNIDMAVENAIQDRWLQLAGETSGEVRVRLAVVPGLADSPAVQQMVSLFSRSLNRASTATLQVVVLAARGLPLRQSFKTTSRRDPYCNVIFGNARQVTPVMKQSQNPTWSFSALFPLELEQQPLPGALLPQQLPSSRGGGPQQQQVHDEDSQRLAAAMIAAEDDGRDPLYSSDDDWDAGWRPGPELEPHQKQLMEQQRRARAIWELQERVLKGLPPQAPAAAPAAPAPAAAAAAAPQAATAAVAAAAAEAGAAAAAPGTAAAAEAAVVAVSDDEELVEGHATVAATQQLYPQNPKPVLLRLEIMDLSPIPPDACLGVIEIDVAQCVLQPGTSWEQWVPLGKSNGEVLVRLAHLAPANTMFGQVPLQPSPLQPSPLQSSPMLTPSVAAAAAAAQLKPTELGALPLAQLPQLVKKDLKKAPEGAFARPPNQSTSNATPARDPESAKSATPPQKVLVDSLIEGVQAANDRAQQALQFGDDLRMQLGQKWIPRMQGWFSGVQKVVLWKGLEGGTARVSDGSETVEVQALQTPKGSDIKVEGGRQGRGADEAGAARTGSGTAAATATADAAGAESAAYERAVRAPIEEANQPRGEAPKSKLTQVADTGASTPLPQVSWDQREQQQQAEVDKQLSTQLQQQVEENPDTARQSPGSDSENDPQVLLMDVHGATGADGSPRAAVAMPELSMDLVDNDQSEAVPDVIERVQAAAAAAGALPVATNDLGMRTSAAKFDVFGGSYREESFMQVWEGEVQSDTGPATMAGSSGRSTMAGSGGVSSSRWQQHDGPTEQHRAQGMFDGAHGDGDGMTVEMTPLPTHDSHAAPLSSHDVVVLTSAGVGTASLDEADIINNDLHDAVTFDARRSTNSSPGSSNGGSNGSSSHSLGTNSSSNSASKRSQVYSFSMDEWIP